MFGILPAGRRQIWLLEGLAHDAQPSAPMPATVRREGFAVTGLSQRSLTVEIGELTYLTEN